MMRMLGMILPSGFRPGFDVPMTLVIEDVESEPRDTRKLSGALKMRIENATGDSSVRFMPNFHFWDEDAEVLYLVIDPYAETTGLVTLAEPYLRFLLDTRNPPLPAWFIDGMLRLLETMVLPVPPANRQVTYGSGPLLYFDPKQPFDEVTVLPFIWGNKERTDEIIDMVRREVRTTGQAMPPDSFQLLPLTKILDVTNDGFFTEKERDLASLQTALFLRWIFDPRPKTPAADNNLRAGPKPTAEALWRFLDRVEQTGFSEQVFEECFKWNTAEVDLILRSYLPYACRSQAAFHLSADDVVSPLSELPLHEATVPELVRMKGRLNRLSIRYIRQYYPEMLPAYLEQALRNRRRAQEVDDADPRLLAELGLGEVDAGNDDTAYPLLYAAVQEHAVHPRAYYELSRIEWQRLRQRDPDMKTPGTAVEQLMEYLTLGLRQKPAMHQSYALLFELWLRTKAKLTPAQVAMLGEGVRLFPGQFRVIFAAVLLQAERGDSTVAMHLGTYGMRWLTDQTERDKLNNLLHSLPQSKP